MDAPYTNDQRLTPVAGFPTLFAPNPPTTQQGGEIIRYETIAIPATQTSTMYTTTHEGSVTTLRKNGQWEYLVVNVQPVGLEQTNSNAGATTATTPHTSNTISGSRSSSSSSRTNTLPSPTTGTSPHTTADARDYAAGKKDLSNTDSGKTAATAAAGVMGGLFVVTLVALLFLIFKLRKEKKRDANGPGHSPPTIAFAETGSAKGQSTIGELSASNTDLMNQLEERNMQLSALQATLMRSNSVPPSLDDRSIASRFKQLEQELKDWVIIHFKSTEQRPDLSPELREILISQVPLFDRLLQQPRSRTMVLRAVAGYVFYKAFESGEFAGVGEGLGALERSMGRNISETEFNKWRSQTFLILLKASTTESKAQVVATISQRIDNLLSPFSTTANQPERLHFLSRIVESAAALSLDLGCQLAKFKVLSEPAETPFHCDHMEDVYQEHETQVDPHTGRPANALDGRVIQAVVFPSVIKWGNERGENYEEMKVLLKATVLT